MGYLEHIVLSHWFLLTVTLGFLGYLLYIWRPLSLWDVVKAVGSVALFMAIPWVMYHNDDEFKYKDRYLTCARIYQDEMRARLNRPLSDDELSPPPYFVVKCQDTLKSQGY